MKTTKYILKRNWQSQHGIQEVLYLGYSLSEKDYTDNIGKLDCIPDQNYAIRFEHKMDAEDMISILTNKESWSVVEVEEESSEGETNVDISNE